MLASAVATGPETLLQTESVPNSSKRDLIIQACDSHDIARLTQLASSSGGLLDDKLRETACKYVDETRRML